MSTLRGLLLGAFLAAPAVAFGQEAGEAPAEAAPAAPETPWIKVCNADETTNAQNCNTSYVLLSQSGSLIASFSLQELPENKFGVGTFVPLGFVIPAGVQLAIDGEVKGTAQFTICVPGSTAGPPGCAARTEVTSDFIDQMKKGNKLAIVLANTQGQPIPIEMTLIGFSKTFDSEGLDPVAARAMEVEQSRELQEDARAAFQRMIERQQAESGAEAPPAPN
jgi:invasion protein IalB